MIATTTIFMTWIIRRLCMAAELSRPTACGVSVSGSLRRDVVQPVLLVVCAEILDHLLIRYQSQLLCNRQRRRRVGIVDSDIRQPVRRHPDALKPLRRRPTCWARKRATKRNDEKMRRPHVIEKDWLASLDDFRKLSNQQWSESRLSAL
jgi:hypothetical protein